MNQEGDSAQTQTEHCRSWTGSHQCAKSHMGKINGKVLTNKYLPEGMYFVLVPLVLVDRDTQ